VGKVHLIYHKALTCKEILISDLAGAGKMSIRLASPAGRHMVICDPRDTGQI
jgi:hypothetical protein